jgi:hypothetical protein
MRDLALHPSADLRSCRTLVSRRRSFPVLPAGPSRWAGVVLGCGAALGGCVEPTQGGDIVVTQNGLARLALACRYRQDDDVKLCFADQGPIALVRPAAAADCVGLGCVPGDLVLDDGAARFVVAASPRTGVEPGDVVFAAAGEGTPEPVGWSLRGEAGAPTLSRGGGGARAWLTVRRRSSETRLEARAGSGTLWIRHEGTSRPVETWSVTAFELAAAGGMLLAGGNRTSAALVGLVEGPEGLGIDDLMAVAREGAVEVRAAGSGPLARALVVGARGGTLGALALAAHALGSDGSLGPVLVPACPTRPPGARLVVELEGLPPLWSPLSRDSVLVRAPVGAGRARVADGPTMSLVVTGGAPVRLLPPTKAPTPLPGGG